MYILLVAKNLHAKMITSPKVTFFKMLVSFLVLNIVFGTIGAIPRTDNFTSVYAVAREEF
jgi:hypothetical protein